MKSLTAQDGRCFACSLLLEQGASSTSTKSRQVKRGQDKQIHS